MYAQLSSGAGCLNFGMSLYLLPYFMSASREDSDKTAKMRRLVAHICNKYQNPMCWLTLFQNILEDLQKNFDDEKAALMRTLARQTDKVAQERQRQIEIAKLKRDQRQLKKDEKLDVVAMMIQSAKQDDKKREEG